MIDSSQASPLLVTLSKSKIQHAHIVNCIRGDLIERIKLRLDQEGFPTAVPQRDVRVVTHEPAP